MESLVVCFFVFVWTVIFFRESEEKESSNRKKLVTDPKPDDVKSGIPLPDADLANPGHTIMKPGTRYHSVLSKPTVRLNRFKCNVLPSIPENKDGEDYVAEMENLSAELVKAKSDLQQQKQTALSLEQPDKLELITLRKSLSEDTATIEQLRHQLSCLMAEKKHLSEQLEQSEITTVKAIEMVTMSYENQMTQLRNELAAKKTAKPFTIDVACGSDVEVAVASTQTESKTRDVGCGSEESTPIPSHQLRTSEQQVTEDEAYGFELDFEMMERFKNRLRSFYIPDRERTKSPVPAAPKPEFHFPVSDIRYKNKPMSGYMVNSDGKTVTYGDAVKSSKKPAEILPTQKTEKVKKPVSEHPKNTHSTTDGPVKTDELIVISSSVDRNSLPGNKLLLTNIPVGDYGRIIGSGGSNIHRLESEFRIAVSINKSVDGNYSLLITGNTEEMRQAAANDIIRGLTVITEFSNLQLFNRIKNMRLNEIGRKFYVRINRTSSSDGSGKFTLVGKMSSCQSAYAELLAEFNR